MSKRLFLRSMIIIGIALFLMSCQSNETDNLNNASSNDQIENNEPANNQTDNTQRNNSTDKFNEQDNSTEKTQLSEMSTDNWEVETLAENLEIPWSINIHDGTVYMTDRHGHILEIADGEVERNEIDTSNSIEHTGEGGLLGFILADDFSETGLGFAYYTFQSNDNSLLNRVVQVEKQSDGDWTEIDVLLDDIPGAATHNGGRLAIGPDEMLYVTTGDANSPNDSQEESNLSGSILRMTQMGEVPSDNPTEDSYVYSYGHRNPQGLAWNETGELYSSEHGPTAQDEINLIQPGNNYGWPVIEGNQTNEGMEEPLIQSGEDTWAPSGIAFWDNQLLVTGLRGESLYYFNEDEMEMIEVFQGEGRLRDVKYQDGAIYLITNNTDGRGTPQDNDDRLLKLTITD
ncbi:PQQ-dependent sugar dehydrogenase [Salipaludibacillus sp. HK11]|uniref:PQQ-dependent sugar dehydrogenase n=1 Tax=Salipaludibacillus sp. HK11 TaxID=3394320 RepID=UPI0039FBD8B5